MCIIIYFYLHIFDIYIYVYIVYYFIVHILFILTYEYMYVLYIIIYVYIIYYYLDTYSGLERCLAFAKEQKSSCSRPAGPHSGLSSSPRHRPSTGWGPRLPAPSPQPPGASSQRLTLLCMRSAPSWDLVPTSVQGHVTPTCFHILYICMLYMYILCRLY